MSFLFAKAKRFCHSREIQCQEINSGRLINAKYTNQYLGDVQLKLKGSSRAQATAWCFLVQNHGFEFYKGIRKSDWEDFCVQGSGSMWRKHLQYLEFFAKHKRNSVGESGTQLHVFLYSTRLNWISRQLKQDANKNMETWMKKILRKYWSW